MSNILEKAILRELSRLIITPERVIKLRVYLYPQGLNRDYLWSNIHYTIKSLKIAGEIKPYKKWLYNKETLDKYGLNWIDGIYQKKYDINKRWIAASSKGGYLLGDITKDYLKSKGIDSKKKTVIYRGKKLKIDAYYPGVAIVVKNVFSDAFCNPENLNRLNDDHRQIKRLFKYCKSRRIKPILIAPLVDKSFNKFAIEHDGLSCRTFIQVIPPAEKALTREIDSEFRINNVKAIGRLPKEIAGWIDNKLLNQD